MTPRIVVQVLLCALLVPGSRTPGGEVPAGSFASVITTPLAFEPGALCVLPPRPGAGRPELAVLARSAPAVYLFRLESSGRLEEIATIGLPGPHRRIACADLDGDRTPELIALGGDSRTLTIIRRTQRGTVQTALELDAPRDRMVAADITGDGRADLMLAGRRATGILTVSGTRRGVYRKGPLLVPEVSVADVDAADINGDGVPDLVFLDWVASRIELLFGITDTIFSDPVSFAVEGEPGLLALSRRPAGRSVLLSVTVPERRSVVTFGIDATGEFRTHEWLRPAAAADDLTIEEVTGDAHEDLILAGPEGVTVYSGLSEKRFSGPAEFSVSAVSGAWSLADLDGDGRGDLVVADRRARRIVVVGNARSTAPFWPDVYAVGKRPGDIRALDCTGDGRDDLAVANTGSRSVSILANRGTGRFTGQQSYELPSAPSQLATLSPPGLVFVLAAHATTDEISALVIAEGKLLRPELLLLATGEEPRIQYATAEGKPPRLRLLVRSAAEGGPGSVSLSLFEQLRNDQFLERQFLARFPRRISAIAAGAFRGGKSPDLILATYDRTRHQTMLSIAPSRGGFEFAAVEPLVTFGDSLRGVRELVEADIDADGALDLLVVPDAPRTRIGVLKGLGPSLGWISDVYPSRDIRPLVRDVSGDGIPDIVLLDELRGSVVMLRGTGAGLFDPPRSVAPGGDVRGIAIGEFRKPGTADLAVSLGDQGVVSIVFNPFR